ncbi:hypothetical protein U2453_31305, partial [Klebsiella pneumoniae]
MGVADLHLALQDLGGRGITTVAGTDPEDGAAHAAGGGGRIDDVPRCRAARWRHPIAGAALLQAQAGV